MDDGKMNACFTKSLSDYWVGEAVVGCLVRRNIVFILDVEPRFRTHSQHLRELHRHINRKPLLAVHKLADALWSRAKTLSEILLRNAHVVDDFLDVIAERNRWVLSA